MISGFSNRQIPNTNRLTSGVLDNPLIITRPWYSRVEWYLSVSIFSLIFVENNYLSASFNHPNFFFKFGGSFDCIILNIIVSLLYYFSTPTANFLKYFGMYYFESL